MRRRLLGAVIALGCFAVGPASAQPAATIETMVADYLDNAAIDLPSFFIESANVCFLATARGLAAEDQETILAAPDFLAGINAVAAAKPEIPATLFPALDSCWGTMTAGEIMWVWVLAEWDVAADEERVVIGTCLLGAIDRLVLDAKRGITRFRFGGFAEAIDAMLLERPDLAGTIIKDMAACGVVL